jgi:hypothetical protein
MDITPNIPLPDDNSEESEKDDSGDDVASCDFYFEDTVEHIFVNTCQPKILFGQMYMSINKSNSNIYALIIMIITHKSHLFVLMMI